MMAWETENDEARARRLLEIILEDCREVEQRMERLLKQERRAKGMHARP